MLDLQTHTGDLIPPEALTVLFGGGDSYVGGGSSLVGGTEGGRLLENERQLIASQPINSGGNTMTSDDEVIVLGSKVYVPRLRRLSLHTAVAKVDAHSSISDRLALCKLFTSETCCVITGGTGGLGVLHAKWIVENTECRHLGKIIWFIFWVWGMVLGLVNTVSDKVWRFS